MTNRHVPRVQRERIFQRSGGRCQRCSTIIDIATFHVSHLRAHVNGGALVDQNLQAWCSRCNLTQGPNDVADTRYTPREWQLAALDKIVKRITNDGAATISAAPGAGKTIFAGLVFEALRDADLIDRMVVLVPRKTLVAQWSNALQIARHLELKTNAAVERRGQHGVVVTYQSLTADALDVHQIQADHRRTLLVLDEVHHVGESRLRAQSAWARAVREMAGTVDVDLHVAGVLNMSGTLWRSDERERISTVRYIDIGRDRIQAQIDHEIGARELIDDYQLRPVDVWRLKARVEMKDWQELSVIESDITDLDEDQSRAAITALPKSTEYLIAFISAVLDLLERAHRSLHGHHVKALIVASTQEDARIFCDEVNRQMTQRGLRPLAELAISDEPDAVAVLEKFRRTKRVGVLCTVGMAGEGYDCPDIAVIGWASNKLTKQYVHQVVARAMRVTEIERTLGIIPASIVVPDIKILIEHLIKYLMPYNPDVLEDTPIYGGRNGSDWDGRGPGGPGRWRRFDVDNVEPTVENVTVSDGLGEILGHFPRPEVDRWAAALESVHVQGSLAPRIMVVQNLMVAQQPFDNIATVEDIASQATKRKATVEEHCAMLQKRLHRLEGWWHYNGDTDIKMFALMVNEAAGIANGAREQATSEQLTKAVNHAAQLIIALCDKTGKPRPKTMRNEG